MADREDFGSGHTTILTLLFTNHGGDELVTIAFMGLTEANCYEARTHRIHTIRLRLELAFDWRIRDPKGIGHSVMCEASLHATLGVAEERAGRRHLEVEPVDLQQVQGRVEGVCQSLRHAIVDSSTCVVPVGPERRGMIR